MTHLSETARQLINRYQGGFPVERRPYAAVAQVLGCTESGVIDLILSLTESGHLSRFGPLFDASKLGGGQTLAALSVPEQDFEAVAAEVNSHPEVAHNYRREHALNMWFVIAATRRETITQTLERIRESTNLPVFDFPKQQEFYVGLWLKLGEEGAVETIPVPAIAKSHDTVPPQPLDDLDHRLIAETQNGLPLTPEPMAILARQLDTTATIVIERMTRMVESGVIRRMGAVPNHYRLGLCGNGMTVWDVPDAYAGELGAVIGRLPFVSHAYLRPRHDGTWPYNLFAMVHGRAREEVLMKSERIAGLLGNRCQARDVLFSSQVLKKTGLRLAA